MIVRKTWGIENVLANEPEYCLKELRVFAGKKCSLHYHPIKKETFIVKRGLVMLERQGYQDELLKPGEARTILPGTPHRFSSIYGAVIMEVSTHHEDSDVVRIEASGVLAGHPANQPAKTYDAERSPH